MAKRFATMFFVMIGVVIFLLSAFVLILFLAPGARIFGIKYILINTHAVNTGKVSITKVFKQKYGNDYFSGSIIINSDEVPVDVEFVSAGNTFYYQYYDNFNGITNSEIIDPSIKVERDDQGNAVFNIESYKTFVYQTTSSKRFLKLFIPLSDIAVDDSAGVRQFVNYGESDPGASKKYKYNLTINAGSANVNFYTTETGTMRRAPAFNTVSISTNGEIKYNSTHIKAMNFRLKTNKSVAVTMSTTNIVDAKNYTIKCSSGKVIVSRALIGDLDITTVNGDVYLNKCQNLKVRTELGDITSEEKIKIEIAGLVDIKTVAGLVDIDVIRGSGQNKIETSSGDVIISSINDGKISTHRGAIEIKHLNNMSLSSDVGSIYVDSVADRVDISTKRGKIIVGTDKTEIKSVTATSVLGDIEIKNTISEVHLETIEGNISYLNKASQVITINAGGKLDAKNLKGRVTMELCGDSYLNFEDITAETNILIKDSCKFVEVKALNTVRSKLYYSIAGNPASVYESNNTASGSNSLKHEGSLLVYGDNRRGIEFYIRGDSIEGKCPAVVNIYFDKSN